MNKSLIILSSIILISCNYDSKTSKFHDYKSAVKMNVFEQGWIPNSLINENMKNIYVKSNLDTNEFFFYYNIPKKEIYKLEKKLTPMTNENVTISKEFSLSKTELKKYLLIEKNDSINIALDFKNNLVYGWKL